MDDIIVILILIILLAIGVYGTIKHFKGESGCCASGPLKIKRKKLKNILYKKEFFVSGMSCEHCKNRVEEAISDIKGVSGKVNLKKGTLLISYEEDVDDDIIIEKINKIGYRINNDKNLS